ncbi:tripartite tricarboxylate transporter substrate binding protein [Comamonadaceae bacterium G21597-S1]|nr:tripartite tricarboxylate transporter substrate binding protein [Comamonadaceae bacterium G21597-S1]
MIKKILTVMAVAGVMAAQAPAQAQDAWPSKPVKVIVPGGPGSGTDTAARLATEHLTKAFGQPFVVENKPGANGMIGTEEAAKAANDGYTLLFTYAAAQVVNQSLYPNVKYDGATSFDAIAQIGAGGNMLVVPQGSPLNNLKDLIAYAKSQPANSLSYGSWGNGSGGHLSMEALKLQAGLQIQHVPYKNAAAVNTDLIGGQIPVAFTSMGSALPLVLGGKMKAIAISGPYRVPQLPNVQTMTEQGVKFDLVAWYGMFAPAGTPKAIIDKVNKELVRAVTEPASRERFVKALGLSEMPIKTPEQFAETVKTDIREWGAVIKGGNIKID